MKKGLKSPFYIYLKNIIVIILRLIYDVLNRELSNILQNILNKRFIYIINKL